MLRDTFFGSYVQTYLQRDLRDFARIGDLSAFLRFLRACAARTAQLLNLADLARESDIAPATARKWLAILEACGIIYLLQPYHINLAKRLIKAPKLHFLGTGLCAYLTAWTSPEALEAGAISEAILESWLVSEFLKSWRHAGVEAPVWYVRDRDGHEVDILVVQDGVAYPVEVKKTASPKPSDLAAFERVGELGLRVGPGGIICPVTQRLPLAPTFDAIPIGLI